MRISRPALAVVIAAISVSLLMHEGANAESACTDLAPASARYDGDDPRVRVIDVEGLRTVVLVPPGYDESDDRYPVVYLLQGGGHTPDATYLIPTDLIEFTAHPETPRAIVVMPDDWVGALWIDWQSGEFMDNTFFVSTLIPAIDDAFRTIPGRAYRSVGGFSAGGFGALELAARNPDEFAAVGALDAVADHDETDPYYQALWLGISAGRPVCEGREVNPFGMLGDPISDRIWWENANPTALAANFSSTALSVYVGNRRPCDRQDVIDYAILWFGTQSFFVYPSNERFHAALVDDGVPHTYDLRCGIHSYRHLERQLHDWWTAMFEAFGSAPPASFDYRRADGWFEVWGWEFRADSARAAEFLDIRDASADGLTLTGSGTETVTSAGYFVPGQVVALTGAVEVQTVADSAGRITFHVDLGPPHEHQQYSPLGRLSKALAGSSYFRTRLVTFS